MANTHHLDANQVIQTVYDSTADAFRVTGSVTTTAASALGRTVVTTVRHDYDSMVGIPVTTGSWRQLIASTSATINEFDLFDSSGQTLELGTGAVASETRLILVFPGGNGRQLVAIPSGTRISIRAVSASATSGEIDINFFG